MASQIKISLMSMTQAAMFFDGVLEGLLMVMFAKLSSILTKVFFLDFSRDIKFDSGFVNILHQNEKTQKLLSMVFFKCVKKYKYLCIYI